MTVMDHPTANLTGAHVMAAALSRHGVTEIFGQSLPSALILAAMMATYRVPVGPALFWLPLLVTLSAALGLAVGMALAALGTFRRDFVIAAPFLVLVWM